MKETNSFTIEHHKTRRPHYDLTLEERNEKRRWILPRGIPKKLQEKRIAIEEPGADTPPGAERTVDDYGEGELKTWDTGSYEIQTENKIKYIFRAEGQKFKGKFLLHNPGWGRWTKKKLWVLEKVPIK